MSSSPVFYVKSIEANSTEISGIIFLPGPFLLLAFLSTPEYPLLIGRFQPFSVFA